MDALLITRPLRPDQGGEAARQYHERIIATASREVRGYRGLYVLVDPCAGYHAHPGVILALLVRDC